MGRPVGRPKGSKTKIINPETGYKVNKTGKIGRAIEASKKPKQKINLPNGKKVCWKWGNNVYCGILIDETATHKYIITHNNTLKVMKK